MALEHYKTKRKGQPKQTSKHSTIKRQMLANAKGRKFITSSKLVEIYSNKIEWVKKAAPKLKE
jgi:CRISPR/Cas system CSM-associated protein Csm2 small subunit